MFFTTRERPIASKRVPGASQELPGRVRKHPGSVPKCGARPTVPRHFLQITKTKTNNTQNIILKIVVATSQHILQRNAYRRCRSPKGAQTGSPEIQKRLRRRPPELAVPATGSQIMVFATLFQKLKKQTDPRSASIEGAPQGSPGARQNGPDYVQARKTEKTCCF